MKVTITKVEPWASNRRSRPWLAKLGYEGRLVFNFVDDAFTGDNNNGGVLAADLEDGDYIAWGQKDFLGSTSFMWLGVYKDGRLVEMAKNSIIDSLKMKNKTN